MLGFSADIFGLENMLTYNVMGNYLINFSSTINYSTILTGLIALTITETLLSISSKVSFSLFIKICIVLSTNFFRFFFSLVVGSFNFSFLLFIAYEI